MENQHILVLRDDPNPDHPTLQRSVTPLQPLETIAEESEERNPSRSTSVSSPADPSHHKTPTAITHASPPPTPHHAKSSPVKERDKVSPCPPVNTTEPIFQESRAGNGSHSSTDPATDLIPRHHVSTLTQDCQGEGALGANGASVQVAAGSVTGKQANQAAAPSLGNSTQRAQARRTLFYTEQTASPQSSQHTPVRRTKSEGHVRGACSGNGQWAVPEVCTDATLNDRLWSKLDLSSHRDSVSSSSSLSSNDTVIDLSLPNLARKSLTGLNAVHKDPEEARAIRPRSAMAEYGYGTPRVTKSKSNPNLRGGEDASDLADDLQPRPLAKESRDPGRLTQRRHTWSRLYMEGLKQASTAAKKTPSPAAPNTDASGKSKSLGDLTSDDITCNFDSKYRSISRSFITRPTRDQRRPCHRTQDDLAEQLRRLTDVEPLTASDFAPSGREAEPEEQVEAVPLRRTSSRSQSRVRYIANRAKQAQERQRLQGLARQNSSPIEERGNPEGACSVARSPCASLDLLSQLPPAPPIQSTLTPDNELFFMLKL
ncbi:hypothetical protein AGOR_G00134910 [Albula goreensis]|uniref:Uncharacterized protein n=1 Tax=Albula goreensis TaxID=1534307 RepID=A0A8T3DAD2_9TELE|nr:hypothetical protein AGOR_G00134910 [Albula goreensis]